MTPPIPRNIDFDILGPDKIANIHDASMHMIESVGMKVMGERTLALLKANGVQPDADGLIRLPKTLVEQTLDAVPKSLTLYTRDGQPAMQIDAQNQVYFGTHADQLELVDPFTGAVRDFLKKDTAMMCRIADALPHIHFVLSVGMSKDIRPEVQTQISFLETLKHFSKTINFSTNDIESVQPIIDMAAVVAGGHAQLAEKPFIFNYCEPIPPLTHPVESTEKLYISARNRIPVVYMPYSMMGGTAPMSFAAALAQNNAEILVGIVITQLVNEGAPFIYGSMPSLMDMRTTVGSYGAVEFHLLVAAASELADHYGVPFYGTAGCTDARVLDEQAVAETTMEIFSTLLSKANLIHDVGVADHCNSVCPELVVLADEMIEMLSHYTQGVAVDPAALKTDLDLIQKVGPGNHFINEMHTMQHFREIHYSSLFSRLMKGPAESEVRAKIQSKINDIMEHHEVPPLDDAVSRELDAWSAKLNG